VAELLAWAVAARANVIVSGGTGAGKTTVLNALAALLPDTDRLITVEDTAELRLPGSHVVRLEARPATADGVGAVTTRDLVRNALRMRPDRIIVGEVRGPEVLDMLWAMNTGHEGSLSTCHANSPLDALRRLEVMALTAGLDLPLPAVRDQLASAVDLVVQVARGPDGTRRVHAVGEVIDPPRDEQRIRLLAGPDGVRDLPRRAPRHAGCPEPDPGWCR
jgi:pilus assembly protein CpaF